MYKYGKLKGAWFCPIYICLSKDNQEREEFLRDAKSCGMETAAYTKNETKEPFILALDQIDNSQPSTQAMSNGLTGAVCAISRAVSAEEATEDVQVGKLPALRTFEVAVTCTMRVKTQITARTLQEAVSIAIRQADEAAAKDGCLVPGSQTVDYTTPVSITAFPRKEAQA